MPENYFEIFRVGSRDKGMSRSNQQAAVELPKIIKDTVNSEIAYEKGKFLGKGGFAKCYEFFRLSDRKLYAGKVVPKTLLQKSHQKVSFFRILMKIKTLF